MTILRVQLRRVPDPVPERTDRQVAELRASTLVPVFLRIEHEPEFRYLRRFELDAERSVVRAALPARVGADGTPAVFRLGLLTSNAVFDGQPAKGGQSRRDVVFAGARRIALVKAVLAACLSCRVFEVFILIRVAEINGKQVTKRYTSVPAARPTGTHNRTGKVELVYPDLPFDGLCVRVPNAENDAADALDVRVSDDLERVGVPIPIGVLKRNDDLFPSVEIER